MDNLMNASSYFTANGAESAPQAIGLGSTFKAVGTFEATIANVPPQIQVIGDNGAELWKWQMNINGKNVREHIPKDLWSQCATDVVLKLIVTEQKSNAGRVYYAITEVTR